MSFIILFPIFIHIVTPTLILLFVITIIYLVVIVPWDHLHNRPPIKLSCQLTYFPNGGRMVPSSSIDSFCGQWVVFVIDGT
jgi:hypothetical protein